MAARFEMRPSASIEKGSGRIPCWSCALQPLWRVQFNLGDNFRALREYRSMEHIDDHDMERYYLGMLTDESELAGIEAHLLWCQSCQDRMKETERYVDRKSV